MRPTEENDRAVVISNLPPPLREQLLELKRLIKEEASLNDFVEFFDDATLLGFIKGKKFDTERAFTTLVNYIQIRYKYPNIFKTLLPSTTASMNDGSLNILKTRDPQNRLVVINRSYKWDASLIGIDDTHKMMMLMLDNLLHTAYLLEIDGLVAVFDMRDMTFERFKAASPRKIYQMVDLLWRNVPIRFSALHVIHAGFLVNLLLKSVHPFLPKKLRQRLMVHSSNESLHEHLSPQILPETLGGELSDEDAFYAELNEEIRKKEDYYRRFAEKL